LAFFVEKASALASDAVGIQRKGGTAKPIIPCEKNALTKN
jgi:hypothetical protein